MNHWQWLATAILLEAAGTTSMKLSMGFTILGPSVLVFVCYAGSLGALTIALRAIDIAIAYAIWAGAGTALIAVIGIVWFHEPGGLLKWASLATIVTGIVGLRFSGVVQ
jgi:small multidrug resistance pump